MPFGPNCEWANMDACIAANEDKDDPSAWCATVMRETEDHCKEKDEAESKNMTIPTIIRSLVPYRATLAAPRERAWNASATLKRASAWAGEDSTKYRRLFVRFDADNTEDFGSYGGPHHDIIDGSPKTVFRGCAAVAVVLAGGRGGTNWPDEEIAGIKAHIQKHYHQFDEQAPWERDEKDFAWLPEERRAAKALGIDLEVALKQIRADAEEVAKRGCPCEDGDTTMSTRVLVIRNDADVSEDIEAPADGIFDEDVAAVSTDGGETWLELEDGRVKDETDPTPAAAAEGEDDPDEDVEAATAAATAAAEAEAAAAAEAEATATAEATAAAEAEVAATAAAEAAAATAAAEAEADKEATPDLILDHSLLGELAETGYMRYLWNLTYALCDVLCGLIDEDDMTVDERNAKAAKALSEFTGLAQSSFSEAVNLAATDAEPKPEDNPFAGMSFVEAVRSILAEDADGLDADVASSDHVVAIEARMAELKTKGDVTTAELDQAKKLIDELLDMPLARKVDGDEDGDEIADINEKYPWLDPALRRKLAAKRGS